MSGTEESILLELETVLDRGAEVDALGALHGAISYRGKTFQSLTSAALGIDSCVFLRLAGSEKREDILDYLNTKHHAPIVVPGQAVQEYWNNLNSVVQTKAKAIRASFGELQKQMASIDSDFGDYSTDMEKLLDRFESEFGYAYDTATKRNISALVELLGNKAEIHFVPRTRFSKIASTRKKTKTPPGFKDAGDGDFFVWADFLFTLMIVREKQGFDKVVLVTDDKKPDWSTGGAPHPLLTAEVNQLFAVPFEIWNAKELGHAVSQVS